MSRGAAADNELGRGAGVGAAGFHRRVVEQTDGGGELLARTDQHYLVTLGEAEGGVGIVDDGARGWRLGTRGWRLEA